MASHQSLGHCGTAEAAEEEEEEEEEANEKEDTRLIMHWTDMEVEEKNLFPRLRRIKHALQAAMIESSSWEEEEELVGVKFPGQAQLKDGLDKEEVETLRSMLEVMKELDKLHRQSMRANSRRRSICASLDQCRHESVDSVRHFRTAMQDMIRKHEKWCSTWNLCRGEVTRAVEGEVQQQVTYRLLQQNVVSIPSHYSKILRKDVMCLLADLEGGRNLCLFSPSVHVDGQLRHVKFLSSLFWRWASSTGKNHYLYSTLFFASRALELRMKIRATCTWRHVCEGARRQRAAAEEENVCPNEIVRDDKPRSRRRDFLSLLTELQGRPGVPEEKMVMSNFVDMACDEAVKLFLCGQEGPSSGGVDNGDELRRELEQCCAQRSTLQQQNEEATLFIAACRADALPTSSRQFADEIQRQNLIIAETEGAMLRRNEKFEQYCQQIIEQNRALSDQVAEMKMELKGKEDVIVQLRQESEKIYSDADSLHVECVNLAQIHDLESNLSRSQQSWSQERGKLQEEIEKNRSPSKADYAAMQTM
ncbi:hypothetical protein GUITHDRAFT_116036 [Guillardia theta CCMP2712]|uniref:Uncharacterized protein n=1 Tax=Guillardia theta (strain CCMP2712) TaxID=905079 RepID=L1IN77_GUITC|nr:hypothetical protein GUITHDRAFT_116036 [Guillardia theta CCMP2712]EKX37731.1 hypothetical protein GUITHDRAFT_116036 [Guillardia theta CCMP2712]|eukprot:XP_005824711.1 hypothetical protein GUITHDRAFT_116036 [Guillardia theta CCMP2712]